jgi:hypothetical protein
MQSGDKHPGRLLCSAGHRMREAIKRSPDEGGNQEGHRMRAAIKGHQRPFEECSCSPIVMPRSPGGG